MPTVTFTHSVKQEQIYIKQLFEEKAWFRREKFPVALPKKQKLPKASC